MFKELARNLCNWGPVTVRGLGSDVEVVGDYKRTKQPQVIENPQGIITIEVTQHDGFQASGSVKVGDSPKQLFTLKKTEKIAVLGLPDFFILHKNKN